MSVGRKTTAISIDKHHPKIGRGTMNILFFAPNYYPHRGGVEKHINELSKKLVEDGHSVTILTIKHQNFYPDYEKNENIEVIRLNKVKLKFLQRIYIYMQIFKNRNKCISADVVHFHDYGTFWYYGLFYYPILKLLNKKVYITFHGWEGNYPPKKQTIIKRKIIEKILNGNICIGHYIEKWYGTKADIVSYGGVEKMTCKDVGIEEEKIIFIGRLEEDTGILEYLVAWKEISNTYPNLKFVICGDGKLRESIEILIEKENINNIKLKGFVSNPEDYIKRAKVVFTSGYLGILEAFSYKKAVISTYNNDLKKDYLEMIPNNKEIMWIAKDSKEIALCIAEALSDYRKAENGQLFSCENNWERVRNDYYKLWGISR
jgi:glycosyltransferase involved in cell wall biosynthesis